ncbi:MAG: hypothetical protein JSW49_02815 [candidate division WOR-3 bacterium]|nr:MAG: hypothetical protein JSW49_02815 [candidate division WOR-3 bacterium]
MRNVLKISVKDVIPGQKESLALQGISSLKEPSDRIVKLYQGARESFEAVCHPVGVVADITKEDFVRVYRGDGRNEASTPVGEIFEKADRLALFAVTVGHDVHERINELFGQKDFALGSMLDSVASAGVEKAADVVEARFSRYSRKRRSRSEPIVTMRYSPGYCGWHVSGQKKLFEFLKPGDIGITLRESFLMEPLKSVSGVLIQGHAEIHKVEDKYPFCIQCDTHSCRERSLRLDRHVTSRSANEGE